VRRTGARPVVPRARLGPVDAADDAMTWPEVFH
jgi:hypothetical protein